MDGFKATQAEIEQGITRELTHRVVGVMQSGRFSQRMAATALLRSLAKTPGQDDIHTALFYKVCCWLDDHQHDVPRHSTAGALTWAIANATGCAPSGVRSCLASYPFALPERLRPAKYIKCKAGEPRKQELTGQVTFAPAQPVKSTLKDLNKVNELRVHFNTLSGPTNHAEDAVRLFTELFAPELGEIKRRLGDG